LLRLADLKVLLQKNFSQSDKLILILSTFQEPAQIAELKKRAEEAGFRWPKGWNPSTTLTRTKGMAIRTNKGWELTDTGKNHLTNLGVISISASAVRIASDLRAELIKISDETSRLFAEESVKCFESELHRSAIVMSWVAAIDLLQKVVVRSHLTDFNKEVRKIDPKWRDALTADDLGKVKESDFLDRLVAISVIGKNVKKELKDCLDRRNGCGHPNSLKIGANTVAHHLEILILNVFQPLSSRL